MLRTNIITGKIHIGNIVIISGRYKMDIPYPDTLHISYLRTAEILLDQQFKSKPTVVAIVHHVHTEENPTKGNTVPFHIATVDYDPKDFSPQTRIMISSVETTARRTEYEYWCEYMVMGEAL
jgi:hypothetical protein